MTPALRRAQSGHPASPPRRVPLSLRAILFGALAVLVAWISVAVVLRGTLRDVVDAQLRQDANLAAALSEHTLRVVASIDQATRRTAAAVVADPRSLPDLSRFANETGLAPDILVQLSLVGVDGVFRGSNLDPHGERSGRPDLSGREHVRVHLADGRAGEGAPAGLFIGKPVLGKVSQRWTLQMSRRIVGPDGATRGVVVASVDPSYFAQLYQRVSLGRTGGVALVGHDRVVRARVIGGQAVGMGETLPPMSAVTDPHGPDGAHLVHVSPIDGVERLVAVHPVADFPLQVAVVSGMDEALAGWRTTRDLMLLLTGGLSLAVAAGVTVLVAGLMRAEQAHRALEVSRAEALAASQAKTEFLAAMSHELRTPLTSIRGFAELMEHRLDQPAFRTQAGLIRRSAEHLNNLLSEILDLSQVEAGAMQLAPEPLNPRRLLAGVVEFFSLAAQAKGLSLVWEVADDVPQRLHGDPLRIKQVLNNLLSNAIKFTPSGGVSLRAERQGGHLLVHVTDTGPGIPAEAQERVFEKFRQADARVAFEHGGTGLGLALSRSLAGLMGGTLSLVSRPGEGACFTLCLPLVQAPPA